VAEIQNTLTDVRGSQDSVHYRAAAASPGQADHRRRGRSVFIWFGPIGKLKSGGTEDLPDMMASFIYYVG
jgi:hypothetical protein